MTDSNKQSWLVLSLCGLLFGCSTGMHGRTHPGNLPDLGTDAVELSDGEAGPESDAAAGPDVVCGQTDELGTCTDSPESDVLDENSTADELSAEEDAEVDPDVVELSSPATIVGVVAAFANTCIWDSNGDLYCMGSNHAFQLGSAFGGKFTAAYSTVPIRIEGTGEVQQVAGDGNMLCVATADNEVKCWGGWYPYTGAAFCDWYTSTPTLVAALTPSIALDGNLDYFLGLSGSGIVTEYGLMTPLGECDDCCTMHLEKHDVVPFVSIAAGDDVACAISGAGSLYCWGVETYNIFDGKSGSASVCSFCFPPTEMGPQGVIDVAVTSASVCAVAASGSVLCFGSNQFGGLGNGAGFDAEADSTAPVIVKGLPDVVQIEGKGANFVARTQNGEVWTWGYMFGSDPKQYTSLAVPIELPSAASEVTTSGGHACALLDNGEVWCWGWNKYGVLGNGTTTDPLKPVKVQFGK